MCNTSITNGSRCVSFCKYCQNTLNLRLSQSFIKYEKKLDRSQFETLQKSLGYPVLYCSIMYKSGKFPIKKSITEANGTKLFMGFWSPQYSKHFVVLGGNKICSLACQFHHKTNALDHDQYQDWTFLKVIW